ncbi:MAG: hypothetical protein RLZZ628_3066 [Bacteroidota bacterium]
MAACAIILLTSWATKKPQRLAEKCEYTSPSGQCTAGVREDKGGFANGGNICNGVMFGGNAKDWYANAKTKFGDAAVGSTPRVGAIVVWGSNTSSSNGHVGVLIGQDDKGNWKYKAKNDYPNGTNWSIRLVSEYANSKNRVKPIGYIYTWK